MIYTIFNKEHVFVGTVFGGSPDIKDLESREEYMKEGDFTPERPVSPIFNTDIDHDHHSDKDLLIALNNIQERLEKLENK
jgi:hypothetical protein